MMKALDFRCPWCGSPLVIVKDMEGWKGWCPWCRDKDGNAPVFKAEELIKNE